MDEGQAAARGGAAGITAMSLLALAVSGRGLCDPSDPVVRADDEALLRGRAAFETLRVYDGRPFRLGAHLERLSASGSGMGLPAVDMVEMGRLAELVVPESGPEDAVLRLIWTAGPSDGRPTGLALLSAIPEWIERVRARGGRAVSLLGVRAVAPWLLPGIKSTSYAINMAAEAEAQRRDADEAIFVDGDGIVLEGTVTNIWWRRGEVLHTPELGLGILAGVTRAALLELAPGLGYVVEEGEYPLAALLDGDEVFTSSSVREVVPVVALDGRPFTRGPAADALQVALRALAAGADRTDPVGTL